MDKILYSNNSWIHPSYKILYEDKILNHIKLTNNFDYERLDNLRYADQEILENLTDEKINYFIIMHNLLYPNRLSKTQLIQDIYNKIINNKICKMILIFIMLN
jgi:hypothetical protein